MPDRRTGGARPAAPLRAAAGVAIAGVSALAMLTGCGGSHHDATPTTSPSSSSASSPVVAPDAAAAAVVTRAVHATERLRSYAFAATTTIAAHQVVRSRLSGRVVRGGGLAYSLRIGHRRTDVVRVPHHTYVRTVPGSWTQQAHPQARVAPTTSLLVLLRGLTATAVGRGPAGTRRVHATITPAVAKQADIPTDRRPADLVIAVDRAGRVTALTVSTSTAAGARNVTVTVHTAYSRFNHVARIRPPR